MTTTQSQPWYRQFWPWFIIAIPAAGVIGCLITIWIAVGAAPERVDLLPTQPEISDGE